MAGDADFDKVALLLHMDGADGSTVITDSSSRPKYVQSRNGAIVSTSQSKFGASLYSGNITGGNVVFPAHTDFDMGSQDFTVEFWVYMAALYNGGNTENFLVQHRTATGYWGFSAWVEKTTGLPVFSMCNTSATIFEARGSEALPVAQWVHFAGTRSGDTLRLFIDGDEASSIAISGPLFGPTDPLVLFGTSNADTRFKFDGYIDDLRITKGVARYTADFTPPTEAFGGPVALSGVVSDVSNAPAARLIRAYREDTGALAGSATSNAVSGAYSIEVATGGAHTVVAYPAAGENLPALTLSGVIPE